jgi:hypothetical protein
MTGVGAGVALASGALAHGSGADEVAFVAVPVALFVAFVFWERRHNAKRRHEDDDLA